MCTDNYNKIQSPDWNAVEATIIWQSTFVPYFNFLGSYCKYSKVYLPLGIQGKDICIVRGGKT